MTALPVLEPEARTAVWGVSGSGKSHLAARLARRFATQGRAVVIIDPHVEAPKRLTQCRKGAVTRVAPNTPEECLEALFCAFLLSKPKRPVTVFADEAPFYLGRSSQALSKIVFAGRHRGFGLVIIGQRPSAVATDIRSQVTKTIWLRMTDHVDIDVARKSSPDLAKALPHLGVGEWRIWPE